jgi:hypothetical protein
MDPYLEEPSLWPDFHGAMLFAIRAAMNAVLPSGYAAFVDRYLWLHEPDAITRTRLGKPDVYLAQQFSALGPTTALAAVTAPCVVTLPAVRIEGQRYVRIVDRSNRRLVTVIEMLSPSNKDPGAERENYLAKRNEYLATETNLVEIDLLRAGRRPPLGDPTPDACDYLFFVCRAAEFPQAGIWSFSVREPLPPLTIPLNPEDGVVSISLKPCFDRVYDEARYAAEVDYSAPPVPPLREPNASWARELLAANQISVPQSQGQPS